MSYSTGLAGDAAAGNIGVHVDFLAHVDDEERCVRLLREVFVAEVGFEIAAIDHEFTRAFGDPNTGGGGFTAAGAEEYVGRCAHGLIRRKS